MKDIYEHLSEDIYYNFWMYLKDGFILGSCKEVLDNTKIKTCDIPDKSIVKIEKNGITYINHTFTREIHARIEKKINKDEKSIVPFGKKDIITVYAYIFIYLCLTDEHFMKDFKKIFDNDK